MKLKFIVNSYRSAEQNSISLKIKQNGNIKYNFEVCPTGRLEFDFFPHTQNNLIEFEIHNKKGKYSFVKNDKIIKDTALVIEKILCNDFDLLPNINLFSNYYTEKNGTLRTNGYMGFNGRYVFKFRYPLSKHLVLCEYY